MRVTCDLWVSALLRRLQSGGDFGAVIQRGATEAGAIFLILRSRQGELDLFGPAPQTGYDDARPSERYFTQLVSSGAQDDVDAKLEREMRFDPDIWVVELEIEAEKLAELIEIRTP